MKIKFVSNMIFLLFLFLILSNTFVSKSNNKLSIKEKLIIDTIYKFENLKFKFSEKKINYQDSYFDFNLLAKDNKNKIEIYLIHLYKTHSCDYFIILKMENILFIKPNQKLDIEKLDSILLNNNFDKKEVEKIKNETLRIQKCYEDGFLLKPHKK